MTCLTRAAVSRLTWRVLLPHGLLDEGCCVMAYLTRAAASWLTWRGLLCHGLLDECQLPLCSGQHALQFLIVALPGLRTVLAQQFKVHQPVHRTNYHHWLIFFWHACNCGFSSVIVFGFGYFAVKFPIISFVVIIRIIRNAIVSRMCSW